MSSLDLPILQNWSCHSCGGCCQQHGVFITEEDQRRIEKQHWTAADGVPADLPLFVEMGQRSGKPWKRLAHQPDGSCVFLAPDGLCRIHAKFGEPAKPLACRIYPYVFHPAGDHIVVSLRFSCPSVALNRGRPVTEQARDLQELRRLVVPADALKAPAPSLNARSPLDWKEAHTVVDLLDEILFSSDSDRSWSLRLFEATSFITVLHSANVTRVRGQEFANLLGVVRHSVAEHAPADLKQIAPPSGIAWTQFRLLAGQYARIDTFASAEAGLRGRWRLAVAAWKLLRGRGLLPELRQGLPAVPFAALTGAWPLPVDGVEILSRYFRIKLHGMHFCGPAYYRVPLTEGFLSLALVQPVVVWLARWIAVAAERTALTADDIAQALSMADHHHGFSPALGTWGFRRRVQNLTASGDLLKLIAAFGS